MAATQGLVDMSRRECPVRHLRQSTDPHGQQVLEPGSYDVKSKVKIQRHDTDKNRDRGIFAGQDLVDCRALLMLLALLRFYDIGITDLADVREAIIRNGSASVKTPLLFHLADNALENLLFFRTIVELGDDPLITLDHLAGSKTCRNPCRIRNVLHQVGNHPHAAGYRL